MTTPGSTAPGAQRTLNLKYAHLLQLEKHLVWVVMNWSYLKRLKEKVVSDGGKPDTHRNTVHICFVLCAQFLILTSSNIARCEQSDKCHVYPKPIISLTHRPTLIVTCFCYANCFTNSNFGVILRDGKIVKLFGV